jgi:Sec7-like guanine-nucleotide exchange factor
MTSQQWIQNLRGVFSEGNLNEQFLLDIYSRIKSQEFKTGADHVTQVQKVQSGINQFIN